MKFLAPFSTIANFVTLVSFGIILYYIFREPISFENRDQVGTMSGFALFFGTVLFALEAIGVVSIMLVVELGMIRSTDTLLRFADSAAGE